jgi:hypothetical protein
MNLELAVSSKMIVCALDTITVPLEGFSAAPRRRNPDRSSDIAPRAVAYRRAVRAGKG